MVATSSTLVLTAPAAQAERCTPWPYVPCVPDRPDRGVDEYEEYEEYTEEYGDYEESRRSRREYGRAEDVFAPDSSRTETIARRPADRGRTVAAAPAFPPPPRESALPKTGTEVAGTFLLGSALIGGGIAIAVRRRRPRPDYYYY